MEDEAEPEPEPGEGEAAHPLRSDHLLSVSASSVTVVVVMMSVGSGRGVPRHDVGLQRVHYSSFEDLDSDLANLSRNLLHMSNQI